MKPIYECDWCIFRGTADIVESHERNCEYNPKNIEFKEKKEWLQNHCPHCQKQAPDYVTYIGCKLKCGWDDDCEPTSDCLQYCKGENMNTVETVEVVEERKTARCYCEYSYDTDRYEYSCSDCGNFVVTPYGDEEFKFCPHCGAKYEKIVRH